MNSSAPTIRVVAETWSPQPPPQAPAIAVGLRQAARHSLGGQCPDACRFQQLSPAVVWMTQRTGRIYLTKQPAQQPIASKYNRHIYKHDAAIPPTLPNSWVDAGHSLALLLVAAISSVGPPRFLFRHPKVAATCSTLCGRASPVTPWRARVIQCISLSRYAHESRSSLARG
ncbi:hypothetical protein BT67DRAFT_36416 [Trichocladium antarcticum]|uniref:Uncharacterized protein n=1 Tax=Trichocladium antarcticum TaxID=1450529 RepID=A0AAN6ZDY8_9PEZI|nr:hypothetical protein BT67DRAFT_36416 [Trichocladium antarcticum]